MNVLQVEIPDLLIIEPKVFGDARGFLVETYQRRRYSESGLATDFVQDSISFSMKGILRGLHYQNPNAQGKLVQVLQGEVFDVAVDLRRSSPTFGRWYSLILSSENKRQFFIPAGFAHGFQVLSPSALFSYKCDNYYSPTDECTLKWDDPRLAIPWPLPDPVLSEKDLRGLPLSEMPINKLFP